MREGTLLGLILCVDAFFLFFGIDALSISYREAVTYFNGTGFLHYLINVSCGLFGQNDWALRLPFVIIHFISVILLYKLSKPLLKRKVDRLTSVLVYVMLPGVSAGAILVNEASLVILLTLLFVWFFQEGWRNQSYVLLIIALFVDNAFAILYLSLFFYGIVHKDSKLFSLALLLFSVSMYMYGFDMHGKPRGYFMDTFGVYAAAFSPLLFLYYMYSLYRIAIKEKKELLWFISFGAIVFSLLLSLRQRLMLEDFVPFAVIAVPLMVRVFFNSFRVRLPRHRRWHTSLMMVVMFVLSLNFVMSVFNKPIYHFINEPSKHFAYKYHVAKELAVWLHEQNINALHVTDKRLAHRLKFYGIEAGSGMSLVQGDFDQIVPGDFTLYYAHKPIVHYKVVKP